MHKRPTLSLVVGLILTTMLAAVLAACGSSEAPTASSSPSSSSSMSIPEQILGHAPTGLAEQIVTNGYFTAANDANYAPQSVVKKDGSLVGFDVDVAKRTAELLGLDVKFQNPAWDSIPTGLQTGRFDVSIGSMTVTPEREKTLAFTEPYYYTPAVVITNVGAAGLDTVESLAGKTIGTAAGSTYYEWLEANTSATIKSYDSSVTSMTDLDRKRLDGVMTAAPTAQQAIAAGQPFQVTGKPFFYEDLGMAMKLDEADWLAMLNYAVKTMHEDGSLTAMSEQWYNGLDLTVQQ